MKQFKKEFLTQHLLVLCAMSIIGAPSFRLFLWKLRLQALE